MYRKTLSHHKFLPLGYSFIAQGMRPLEVVAHLTVDNPHELKVGTDTRRALYQALYARYKYNRVPDHQRKSHASLAHLYEATRELFDKGYTVKAIADWLHKHKCGSFAQLYGMVYRLRQREIPHKALRIGLCRKQELPGWIAPQAPAPFTLPTAPDVDFSCD